MSLACGDIYEWFAETGEDSPRTRAEWFSRAAQDRCLAATESSRKRRATLNRTPPLGEVVRTLPAKDTKEARTASLQIRATRVTRQAPARTGVRRPNLEIYSVLAREENPPAGPRAIAGMLLTSRPVTSLAEAVQILN